MGSPLLTHSALLKQLSRNGLSLFGVNLTNSLVAAIIPITVARALGAQQFGVWAFGNSWAAMLSLMSTLGLDLLLVRECARDRGSANQHLANNLVAKLLLFFVLGGLLMLAAPLFALDTTSVLALRIVILIAGLSALGSSFTALLRAFEISSFVLLLGIGSTLVQVLGLFIWRDSLTLNVVLGCTAISGVLQLLGAVGIWHWHIYPLAGPAHFSMQRVFTAIQQALPLAATGFVGAAQSQSPTLLLGYLSGGQAAGWFGVANRVSELARLLPSGLLNAVYPMFATARGQNKIFFAQVFWGMVLLGAVLACGLVIASSNVLSLVFGAKYVAAQPLLFWLGIDTFFALPSFVLVQFLLARHCERYVLNVSLASLALHLALCATLIRWLGPVGAPIAILLGKLPAMGLFWRRARRII